MGSEELTSTGEPESSHFVPYLRPQSVEDKGVDTDKRMTILWVNMAFFRGEFSPGDKFASVLLHLSLSLTHPLSLSLSLKTLFSSRCVPSLLFLSSSHSLSSLFFSFLRFSSFLPPSLSLSLSLSL